MVTEKSSRLNTMYKLKIGDGNVSKVQQIVNGIVQLIESGKLIPGAKLPSINEFTDFNNAGRDTVERAYRQLRKKGYINSFPARGYFVAEKEDGQLKVLLIFNKLSSFKKIVYDGVVDGLGKKAIIDLQVHHYDPAHLKELLEASVGKYNYYAIMPHFFSHAEPQQYINIIKTVPAHKLVLLDKALPQLQSSKAVFQDFNLDILEALSFAAASLKKYKSITLIFPAEVNHPTEVIDGIKTFCKKENLKFYKTGNITTVQLRKDTVYIALEEEDLANLIKKQRQSKLVLGKDIGIISFNETVFKELLNITVVTTDFYRMGLTAALLILNKESRQVRNPFKIIHRGSL